MVEYSEFLDEDIKFDKIERLDSEGGTCEAYIVHIKGKAYFMKRLRSQYSNDPNYRLIFNKEFEIGNSMNCCYIPQYVSMGEDGKGLYILMEYVHGTTLQKKLEEEPAFFDNDENVDKFIVQLLEGLKWLHSNNIAHLDITPKNIILCQINNNVKIIDLGFCIESSYRKTAGYTPGENAAPELKSKLIDQIDASTDLYEVGVLLGNIEKARKQPLPHYLRRIKERCLQPQKEKRYSTADAVIGEIKLHRLSPLLRIAACVAAIIAACIVFTYTPAYESLCNYIAWERGLIPEKFEENGVFYRITDHDARTVEITYKGKDYNEYKDEYTGSYVFPARVTHRGRTFRVTSFAEDALSVNIIRSIEIENGIDSIGNFALSRNPFEGTLFIPASVKWIGKGILDNCIYLEKVVVDAANPYYDSREECNAIIETATNTFIAGCSNSKIPQGITKIADYAFSGHFRLGSINIPESVTYIGDYAFHYCPFYRIALPQGLTHIGDYAFQMCNKLVEIDIPQNVTYIGEAALSNCGYSTLVIPDKVTYIGAWAFDKCPNLTTVTIGESVASIGVFAFDGCDKLTKIVSRIPADKLFAVDGSVFGSVAGSCTLYVPRGAKATYQKTAGWNHFAEIIEQR
ncbi:MAG: leucine-rich repeat protein [Bacteroidaceae bacterium]|nr:leucine-rich repeat protein [Bacteroidaceae bacterium]